MFNLNEQSKSPKYERLIEKIKELIFCEAIKTGESIPYLQLEYYQKKLGLVQTQCKSHITN